MRLPDEPEQPLQINIVPLIDVMFALLTFFIISSLFLTQSEGISVNLPKATTAQIQHSTEITVSIDAEGHLALNRQPIELDTLEGGVRKLIKPNQESLIVLNADKEVKHGEVVQVMDRLRNIKEASLAIATQNP